ncbi:NAC domain-containing protein 8-like [Hibiscus syriacus]|uniref:NAC domain-containing protein 8-like n=1 Tax=Hibiscus syriacus TaxID=106335 RepID=A0A6A2ZXR9_HIBSY|nr:CRM-domain containing factor CFM9, mitochondrial-like [Hibiscus syriacus]KAE8695655.1 NAC domain-containing protein 8-like [Hibiscus syriacus]
MFAARNLQKHCLKILSSLLQSNSHRNVVAFKETTPTLVSSNLIRIDGCFGDNFASVPSFTNPFNGCCRMMSTSRGRSMRSKVERRMQKESGKTAREIRRAKKIKKKLMTDEERLIYNLKRAKKKVALLLQKLKKYELPELPPSVHDPELFTPEQLQAFKKIGFRNKNYVPVGVRGVFGGVVQNMHLHWKFHETVQVCCDNLPKEKIKEMATMLARLSGGIVINIHNVKTIIMFRGRNYRQPKNLIPINTLTKRKALFKARFEQALEAQKLNIKKIEQELRRKGLNPEDPVAMASIQRVASTFFNAIDEKEGSPYVFRGDQSPTAEPKTTFLAREEAPAESDQEELDRFIAEIEDAADREWAEGEEEEKEEIGRIRYLNRQEFGGRPGRFDNLGNDYSDDEVRGSRGWKDTRGNKKTAGSDDEYEENFADAAELDQVNAGDVSEVESDDDNDSEEVFEIKRSMVQKRKQDKVGRWNSNAGVRRNTGGSYRQAIAEEDSEIESMLGDLDNAMLESDAEKDHDFRASNYSKNFRSSSDEEDEFYTTKGNKGSEKNRVEYYESDYSYADNAYGKLDRIDRGNNAGLKKNLDAEFSKTIAKEADDDVFSD